MEPSAAAQSKVVRGRSITARLQYLMTHHVENILLVSSLYDSFILAEDGNLGELILSEFLDLNLRHTPEITHVASGAAALELLSALSRFDLIIASLDVGDMNVLELTARIREAQIDTPVVLLAYDGRELKKFIAENDVSPLERIFLWQGDVKILLAIVKYIEDRQNLAHDTGFVGVPAIILVEDSIRFYSSFLPVIYTEVLQHSQRLIPGGLNLSHKLRRIQARPKILLCETFEEAWGYITEYTNEILGVIADIEFPRDGELDPLAGVVLARQAHALRHDIPIMLQSSRPENSRLAEEVEAAFLLKNSPTLLQQLRSFMAEGFGFGDFIFRMPDGREVARAANLRELADRLATVPAESLLYHASGNHFSRWLKIRTAFALARRWRPLKASDFNGIDGLRRVLIHSIEEYRRERNRGVVIDFHRDSFDGSAPFCRVGSGSLGGKARGLAFINYLLKQFNPSKHFEGVTIAVPPSIVLGTDIFDAFVDQSGLRDMAIGCEFDDEIVKRFMLAPFPESAEEDLAAFIDVTGYPLAVRSSSLLEDNQYQPFAGIYDTYMLPNNHHDPAIRLLQLVSAIKRVYASTFSQKAKAYLRGTPFRLEEEKMAVVIQQLMGSTHGQLFYPDFAGVARSHNFYPTPPFNSDDGIAAVALGLGRTVVEGERCLRFCPKYPRHILQFSSIDEILANSQREFWALDLGHEMSGVHDLRDVRLVRLGLDRAEEHGSLSMLGSTYSAQNNAVYDGISRPGARLVSFAPILKHNLFPLADILAYLLEIGEQAASTPVEIEFAVNLSTPRGAPKQFGYLQMRPLALSRELDDLTLGEIDRRDVICESSVVLGNGRIDDIRDIVLVDVRRFERSMSQETARDIGLVTARLESEQTPYLLIGVGRWGSADPWLGIPIGWDEIAGVRVIVEAGFKDMRVTPSQGTHFFQNLTSSHVGYFTINEQADEGFLDWDWLLEQPALHEVRCVRHVRVDEPVSVVMDGKTNRGVIFKPGVSPPRETSEV